MLQLKYLVLKLLSLAFYFCLPFPFLLGKIISERERERERDRQRNGGFKGGGFTGACRQPRTSVQMPPVPFHLLSGRVPAPDQPVAHRQQKFSSLAAGSRSSNSVHSPRGGENTGIAARREVKGTQMLFLVPDPGAGVGTAV